MTELTPPVVPSLIGNKRVKQKKETFWKFICDNKNKHFVVCAHDNPDPDAMACALAMQHVLSFAGADHVEIYYCGEISHPQNRAMQNVLNISAKKWTRQTELQLSERLTELIFVFVDCAGQQKNMSIPFDPHIVIDHHKNVPEKNTIFIHDEVGSCSTLMTDLMLSLPRITLDGVDTECFDPDTEKMRDIVTALAIGIKTDTLDFRSEGTTEDDFKAYKLLSRYLSEDKFHKIVNYELPPYVFDAEEVAWKNKKSTPPNLITGLGYVDDSRSDCIPYLADKMMRLQGIQTVVVYAIVGNSIRASVRTTSASLDAQGLVTEIFGEGNGGAKHGSGGAKVLFTVFLPEELDDEERNILWDLTKGAVEKRFAKVTQK